MRITLMLGVATAAAWMTTSGAEAARAEPKPAPAVAAAAGAPLRLTFDDGFDQRPDPKRWRTAYKTAGPEPKSLSDRSLYNNRERQVYFDKAFMGLGVDPFSTGGGVLTITAKPLAERERAALARALDLQPQKLRAGPLKDVRYSSGVLTTRGLFEQRYGYFEIRTRWTSGKGLWPAFWLLPSNGAWPPEIDVMEALGHDMRTVYQSVHTKAGGKHVGRTQKARLQGDDAAGFHTYGVLWTPGSLRFFIDGVQTNEAAAPTDATGPMYMIVNLAVGGKWPGDPDVRTRFPARMEVDYVRAWKLG
ncbi:glycoside hydrolase family 16 protein [Caulobacter segnis]|uniref:glycoside hydrolase family 16 protein n=1 Tax=Caulobacter segnis TaxID=88688 RepID=UPI00240F15CC|nr:glycoside hydrolase family 16 protein [Caulobacter segnis]MDG2520305.1 glycoside hydrolase family 16 protein [Caulobacter segnis]